MIKDLKKEELVDVNGGILKTGVGLGIGIGGAVTFLIGLISGWVRPYACTSSK